MLLAIALSSSFPLSASATSYLPGQTLNPNCAPTDPTCIVVPNTTAGSFIATSSSATSTFAGNVQVSGNVAIGTLSGILRAVAGVITNTLVSLTSDVTGILGIVNGGTGISSAPSYGQLLVGNGSGGYALIATSSLGISAGAGAAWGSITGTLASQADLQAALNAKLSSSSLATSALLAGLVSDETGSGSLVFANSPTFAGTPVFGGGLVNYSVNSTTTIPNNTPYAYSIATSSTGTPLVSVDTTNGASSVNLGNNQSTSATIMIGAAGEASSLIFGASTTLEGYGIGQPITIGQNNDVVNFGVNVGIGTTTPGSILAINGVGNFVNGATSTLINGLNVKALNVTGTATSTQANGINLSSGCFSINGTCISGAGSGSSQWTAAGSNIYYGTGNIGIGTTSPSALITLDSSNATGTIFRLSNASSGGHVFDLLSTGSNNTGGAGRFDIFDSTAGAARLSIASNGNVGIGTTSPYANFAVAGTSAFNGNVTLPGNLVVALGANGTTFTSSNSVPVVNNGGTYGNDFIQTIQLPSSPIASSTVAIGTRNDMTLIGNGSNIPSDDILSGNFTTAYGVFGGTALSGTLPDSGGFQSGVYVNNAPGATFTLLRGYVDHFQNNSADTISTFDNIQPILTNNAGTIGTYVDYDCENFQSVPGGGTITTSYCVNNYDSTKVIQTVGPVVLSGSSATLSLGAGASVPSANASQIKGSATGWGSASAPSFTFVDGTGTGMYETSANAGLGLSIAGTRTVGINASQLFMNAAGSPEIQNAAAGTLPNIVPNRGDALAGIGANSAGNVSLYADKSGSATEMLRLTATSSDFTSGNVGIGTTTPYSKLEVFGPDTASTSVFAVVNSASTTEFTVYDTGNAVLAGSLTQNSDQRLKTNIATLDGSSSLSEINNLNPITFNWIDPNKSSVPQFGFIAQQVENVFPNLISTTSPTALTPDGTLSLNYIDLISPIIAAIQQLNREITSLASGVAGFANSFTSKEITATNELCIGSTCINENQLKSIIAIANQSGEQSNTQSNSDSSSNSSPSSTSGSTTTPPEVSISGDNPATIQVGASYTDLGAVIRSPTSDLNLGIKTYLNGALENPVELDTTSAATDTIDYVVTDSQGITSTSTRIVYVVNSLNYGSSSSQISEESSSNAATSSIQ